MFLNTSKTQFQLELLSTMERGERYVEKRQGAKKGKKNGFEVVFFIIMTVVVLAAGGYAVAFYHNFARSAGVVYNPVEAQQVRDSAILLEEKSRLPSC